MPFPIHKMLLYCYEKDVERISSRTLNMLFFGRFFAGIALKLEKVGPQLGQLFQVSILPRACNPLQQMTEIDCENNFLAFKKIESSVT